MRQELVSKCRVLYNKVPLARAIISTLCMGVVGSGLHLNTEDELFDALSSTHSFDSMRQQDLFQLQQQAFETMMLTGEAWLIRQKNANENYSSWFLTEPDYIFNPPFLSIAADGNYYYKNHLIIDGIEFASNEDTDAQFHASILLDVKSDAVSKTATGKVEIENEEQNVSMTWSEDGAAILTVTYIVNDNKLTTYVPIETLHSGRHILNLYYPLSGLEENTYNIFKVRMNITGGVAFIDRGQGICTISGQGLSSNRRWDGRLEFDDQYEVVDISGAMRVPSLVASVNTHMEIPKPVGIQDRYALVTLSGIGIVGMDAEVQVNPVIVAEIIEVADRDEMNYSRYFIKSDTVFEMQTSYQFKSRELEIDSGRMCKVSTNTEQYARIDRLEVGRDD